MAKEKTTYQTGARTELLTFFAEHPDCQWTVDELLVQLACVCRKPIAKSTLYRQLCAFCREGILQRFDGTDPQTGAPTRYYQPVGEDGSCTRHFHLKCLRCGVLQHLSCDQTEILLLHLLDRHRFSVDCGRSILYGVCQTCQDSDDESENENATKTSEKCCPCGCGKVKHRVQDYGLTR